MSFNEVSKAKKPINLYLKPCHSISYVSLSPCFSFHLLHKQTLISKYPFNLISKDDSPISASYPVPLTSASTSAVACSHSSFPSVLFSSSGQPFQVQNKAICKEPVPIVQQKPSYS